MSNNRTLPEWEEFQKRQKEKEREDALDRLIWEQRTPWPPTPRLIRTPFPDSGWPAIFEKVKKDHPEFGRDQIIPAARLALERAGYLPVKDSDARTAYRAWSKRKRGRPSR
jgi:hypothetical protein